LLETRTAGLLQPLDAECQVMFSDTIATTPGRNGSAALLGSVPAATRRSATCGVGGSVGEGEGLGVGLGVGGDVVVETGDELGVVRGVGLGVAVACAVKTVLIATVPPATARMTIDAITAIVNPILSLRWLVVAASLFKSVLLPRPGDCRALRSRSCPVARFYDRDVPSVARTGISRRTIRPR
jgi:hypothetical protein